jgi:hypothetical protein
MNFQEILHSLRRKISMISSWVQYYTHNVLKSVLFVSKQLKAKAPRVHKLRVSIPQAASRKKHIVILMFLPDLIRQHLCTQVIRQEVLFAKQLFSAQFRYKTINEVIVFLASSFSLFLFLLVSFYYTGSSFFPLSPSAFIIFSSSLSLFVFIIIISFSCTSPSRYLPITDVLPPPFIIIVSLLSYNFFHWHYSPSGPRPTSMKLSVSLRFFSES